MTPRQAAEYRDELARRGIAIRADRAATRAAAARVAARVTRKRAPTRVHSRPHLPPKSERLVGTPAERHLADRMLPHVCSESVVDRDQHALGVARMLLNMGVKVAAHQKIAHQEKDAA